MNNTAIIILAAGRAARFGGLKQLQPFQGKTLLQHVIDEALATGASPVVVVTGANAEAISNAVADHRIELIYNEKWTEGKGTGIAAGVRHVVSSFPEMDSVILAVCDQPFVTTALFRQLQQTSVECEKGIVASAYAGTIGTPVLLSRQYFSALLDLQKEEGAKKIIAAHLADVATVDFPKGEIDIDTKEEYARWIRE